MKFTLLGMNSKERQRTATDLASFEVCGRKIMLYVQEEASLSCAGRSDDVRILSK